MHNLGFKSYFISVLMLYRRSLAAHKYIVYGEKKLSFVIPTWSGHDNAQDVMLYMNCK